MDRTFLSPVSRWLAIVLAVAAVITVLAMTGCSSAVPAAGNVDNKATKTLAEKGVRFIDVRTASEFDAGHMPNAENVPLDQLPAALAAWDPAQPVLVYCATGARSAEAMAILTGAGFKTVYNLTQGIAAWDGEVTTAPGGAVAAGGGINAATGGLPIMYEFYTDW
jgi:rhodanese-related sulfurtransferase